AVRHQAGLVRGYHRNAAARRQPDRTRSAHLPRIDAGNRRRTLPMGPSTPEHNDQCERSTNRHGGLTPPADLYVKERGKEKVCFGGWTHWHLFGRRPSRTQARGEKLHSRSQTKHRNTAKPP